MIIILPLVPIIIAIICIALGLFGEIQSNLSTINTILIVVVSLVFAGLGIYGLTRKTEIIRKILGIVACGIGDFISTKVLMFLIKELASIEFGLIGLLEFVFVLALGGCICLAIVLGCICACCKIVDDDW